MSESKNAEAIRSKLEQTVGPVLYSDVAAHLGRDAVFIVDSKLSLVAVAVAVAMDDVDEVGAWIASGALRKPTPAEREAWAHDGAKQFLAVVVQPFVLLQELMATAPVADA